MKRTCPVCSVAIPEDAHGRRIYCSRRCGKWAANHMREDAPPCNLSGCDKPVRARGLCANHYAQIHQPDRHKKVSVKCTACGKSVQKFPDSRRRPVCSTRCRYFVTWGRWPTSTEIVGPISAPPVVRSVAPPVVELAPTRRGFLAVECNWCGVGFIHDWRRTGVEPRFCTRRCAKQASKARRRLSQGRFDISPVARRAIYDRDEWTCQLCSEPIDREAHFLSDWAPSLDHIEPQSHALIPDHSEANLQTAHRWCNAVRGDGTYHVDFFDVA